MFTPCDFRDAEKAAGIAPGSITLVITNPPLGRRVRVKDMRGLIADLLLAASKALEPGGLLIFTNPLRDGPSSPSLNLEYRQAVDLGLPARDVSKARRARGRKDQLSLLTFCTICNKVIPMKAMTASEARQNFGQFLDYGIQEPVVIKRHQRDLGVFLPMALYRNLVSAQNRKITRSMDKLQAEARKNGLTAATLDRLLAAENPS
jgi:PHD/YefM family antitoxin component YafN of YafNO toxin-antitoxin module